MREAVGNWSSFVYVVGISMRREAHQKKYSDVKVISLGTGDTTQPIASNRHICHGRGFALW